METLLALFRSALRIRLVEEEVAARYAEQEMRCPVHLSIGQEGVAVGVCAAMRRTDQAVSTHRAHGHYLAKGGDLKAMLAELYGRAAGCCGGRGGSMHLFDTDAGLLVSLPIVGSSIAIGVGIALAARQRGTDQVCAVFVGDAAVEEGVFHESANLASLHRLPVLFVCENNLYSVYTPLRARQPDRPIGDLATAHGIPVMRADGNDVLAVREVAECAVERARSGLGPTFLELTTYRWREHCGPHYDNDLGYRTIEEFERWRALCPVDHLRRHLVGAGLLTEAREEIMRGELTAEIRAAFEFARSAPFPDPASANEHVYA